MCARRDGVALCPRSIVATYRVLTGISYPPSRRAEAGDLVSDLPAKSVKWLREQGYIELVDQRVKSNRPLVGEFSEGEDD